MECKLKKRTWIELYVDTKLLFKIWKTGILFLFHMGFSFILAHKFVREANQNEIYEKNDEIIFGSYYIVCCSR